MENTERWAIQGVKAKARWGLSLVLLVCLVYGGVVAGYGVFSQARSSDLCVVFGNTVHEDGTPSNRLKARLEKAVELYRRGYCQTIIASGGLGKEGHDEASVMRSYLLASGVPASHVVQDSSGTTTSATIEFTTQYCAEHKYHSVLAVSQYFHLLRIRTAFARVGVKRVSVEAPTYVEFRDLYALPREMVALPVYWFRHH